MAVITIQAKGLNDVQGLLADIQGGTGRALSRSINRTIKGVRTDVTDEVKASVNLTKSFIQKQTGMKTQQTFIIHNATPALPKGSISTRGANVPLIQYSNQRGKRQKYPKNITVQVKKSRGKHRMRHMFIPQLRSGHRGLFVQVSGKTINRNRKIEQKFGPRVPDILSNKEVMEKVENKASVRMDKNLAHEVDYLLSIQT